MLELKLPVPLPLLVMVGRAMVGPGDVLQQTPLTVTESPPAPVTFPPLVALVGVMEPTDEVVTVGAASLTQRTEKP